MASLPSIWDLGWLNENSQRRFPFNDEASLKDVSGSIQLPDDFIVDMLLPVHVDPTIDPLLFHLLTVSVYGTGVTITFGYNGTAMGVVIVDASTFTRNGTYYMYGTGPFYDTVGKIVIGSLTNILKISGSYNFAVADGRLSPTAIVPDIRGVSAILLKNGTEVSDPIQNNVTLQAGRNMFMTFVPGVGTLADPNRIVFNAIDGAGLNAPCACDEAQTLPCIQTIDGIGPDGNGNFNLLDSECLKLDAISNGLQLDDSCSKPCCGCQELDIVRETMERVVTQVNSLENLASRLEASLSIAQINVLRCVGLQQ